MTSNILSNWEKGLKNEIVMTENGMAKESFESIFPELKTRLGDKSRLLDEHEIAALVSIVMDCSHSQIQQIWVALSEVPPNLFKIHPLIVKRILRLDKGLPVEYRK